MKYLIPTSISSVKNKIYISKNKLLRLQIKVETTKSKVLRVKLLRVKTEAAARDFLLQGVGNYMFKVKACVRYFLLNFYFSPNDSPSKTLKDVFYFI